MEPTQDNSPVLINQCPSREWARLISKLRWIGLEEQARRLEQVVSTLPPEERGTVLAGPISTD
jgi:hypothetical protein